MSMIGKKARVMSWNYRVVREVADDEDVFTVREVFYDDDGKPEYWSDACSPQGETHDGLRADLGYMLMALEQPVVEMDDLPNRGGGVFVPPWCPSHEERQNHPFADLTDSDRAEWESSDEPSFFRWLAARLAGAKS
jgi:hypothetical protein